MYKRTFKLTVNMLLVLLLSSLYGQESTVSIVLLLFVLCLFFISNFPIHV